MLSPTVVVIVGAFVVDAAPTTGPRSASTSRAASRSCCSRSRAPTSGLDTAVDVIRNRVDGLGIAEPDVQRQGNTIVVTCPA